MVHFPRLGSVIQVVAIVVMVIGIAIGGYLVYLDYQSSPYMIQIEGVDSTAAESVAAYTELSPSRQAVFEQLLGTGPANHHAAQVSGEDVVFFANHVVQYQGKYYSFEFIYDPSSTMLLNVSLGLLGTGVGAGLFVVGWVVRKRRSASQNSSAA